MRKELILEAESVEEAIRLAAEQSGVAEDKLTVTVLQEPQKKTLGLFGGSTAKIKVEYETEESAAKRACAYLQELLDAMGARDLTVSVQSENDESCQLAIDGEDVGFVIGRRGDTLDALQYLTSLVANRTDNSYYRVTLNVGDYREKREQSLTGLARRYAAQAAKNGRKHSLEPMNPYERRIIHTAVQGVKGATSWSVGKEPNRHVIIGPSDDNPVRNKRSDRKRGGRRGNEARAPRETETTKRPKLNDSDVYSRYAATLRPEDRPVREFVSRKSPLPVADGVTPPEKTVSEVESGETKLYGRIDIDALIVPERRTLKDVGLDDDIGEE